jgi:murein DD-endopeptidase MepM/ murein hydrolase activator NlpD
MSGYGKVVWIDHDDDLRTVYAHLSEIRAVEGETVGGDDVIGLSGSSGGATGPHLHFEIWRRGREVDPVLFLGGTPRTG